MAEKKRRKKKVETDPEKLREESEKQAERELQEELTNAEATEAGIPQDETQEILSENAIQVPFDVSKLSKEQLEMAKGWGLDVEAMAEWFFSVEARFKAFQETLPDKMQEALTIVLNKEKVKQQAAMQQMMQQRQQQGQGGGLGNIQQLAGLLGGGGQDEEMANLSKELVRASIDRMKREASQAERITDAVVSKIAGKAIGKIIEK